MFSFGIVVSGLRQESEMFVFNSILYYLLDEQMRIKNQKRGESERNRESTARDKTLWPDK